MKRAILLRHASAEDAREDALRGLSARGREEAARAGSQIAALGGDWVPTRALCSSALRARATLERVRPALAALREVELSERRARASC
jgi:phosphohistidine phosphatase SixA